MNCSFEPKGYFIFDTASAHPHATVYTALFLILEIVIFYQDLYHALASLRTFLQEIIRQEALEEKQKNLLLVDGLSWRHDNC